MRTARVVCFLGVSHPRTCGGVPDQVPSPLVRVSKRFGGRAIEFLRVLGCPTRQRASARVFPHPTWTTPTEPFTMQASSPSRRTHTAASSLPSVGRIACRGIPSDTRTPSATHVGVSSPPRDPSVGSLWQGMERQSSMELNPSVFGSNRDRVHCFRDETKWEDDGRVVHERE